MPCIEIARQLEEENIEPYTCHYTTNLYCVRDPKEVQPYFLVDVLTANVKLIDQFVRDEGKKYKTPDGKKLIKTLKCFRDEYTKMLSEALDHY